MGVITVDDHHGYIDLTGKVVIPPVYLVALPFSEGLALVCRDEQHYQYITPTGEVVITLKRGNGYQAQPFAEGLAGVCCDCDGGLLTNWEMGD